MVPCRTADCGAGDGMSASDFMSREGADSGTLGRAGWFLVSVVSRMG
jgi:hypothetical protein